MKQGDHTVAKAAPESARPHADAEETVVRVEILPEHPAYDSEPRSAVQPAHAGDAGIDLVACEDVVLGPGERAAVSAGIRIALPAGLEAQVRPRSGQALSRGLTVLNAPGTIDSGYRGVVRVLLFNANPSVTPGDLDGSEDSLADRLAAGIASRTLRVRRGERIAQLVFARFVRPDCRVVGRIDRNTGRGEGGFGSTDEGVRFARPPVAE